MSDHRPPSPRRTGRLGWRGTGRADQMPADLELRTPDAAVYDVHINDILVSADADPDEDTIARIQQSVETIGLQAQGVITVRWCAEDSPHRAELVVGRQRLEAFRRLGWTVIPCAIFEGSEAEAALWQLSENVARKQLTVLETAELIRRWRELLAAEKGAQTEQVSRGGRGITGGNSEVARRLNLDRNKVRRFAHISGLSDDAKQFAISHNMDDIGTPLEDAARAGGAAEQVAVLARHVAQREVQRRDRQLRQPVSPAEVDRRFRRTMNETATEFAGLFRDLRPWTGGPTTQDELATARQHLEQWLAVYREILPPPCRSLIEQALLHMT